MASSRWSLSSSSIFETRPNRVKQPMLECSGVIQPTATSLSPGFQAIILLQPPPHWDNRRHAQLILVCLAETVSPYWLGPVLNSLKPQPQPSGC